MSARLYLRRKSGWILPDGFEKACRCFSERHHFFVDVLLFPRDFPDAERPDASLAAGFDFGTALRFAADLLLTRVMRAEPEGAAFMALCLALCLAAGLAVAFAREAFAPAALLPRGFGFATDVAGFSA